MAKKFGISIFISLLTWINGYTQDLEKVDLKHPVKLTGSFSTGLKYYGASGISNRFDPLIWTSSGNLNLNIYGVTLPFSFLYSTQNSEVRQPFNRFGVTPRYKWAKAYLGYTSMNFSQFTFSGNSFLGGGIELTPNKFRFSAVYGRLRQAVASNFSSSFTIPTYRRMGYGVKVGYGDTNNFIDFILFKAYDDANSIIAEDSLNINPQDNLVVGVNGRYKLTKRLGVSFELATSAVNRDRRAEETNLSSRKWLNRLGGLFQPTFTTQVHDAIQAGISYNLEFIDFSIDYNRVDPGYQTLSTYFFNNDREEITFNTGLRLMNNKLSIRGGIGQQRNNLAGGESTTLTRLAGNAGLNYVISSNLNFAFTYSNFSSTVEFLVDEFQADSLNYAQVSESFGANIIYSQRKGSKTHSLALNANLQSQNVDTDTENPGLSNSSLWNVNGRYNINFIPVKTRLNLGLNFNSNDLADRSTQRYGLSLGVSKIMLKNRLQTALNLSGYNSYQGGVLNNFTSNGRFSATYKVNNHHSLSLGSSLIYREIKSTDRDVNSFEEYRADINYRYRF
ncbi:hypothetical protein FNH22_00535 [Fulvivirga sp. M361]|uniref:hypothetical protein n=1 Tax=Fulvivirga sp. M361 TaxID=2594266 RepID=UPI001179FB7B|nr:hypothetical protein [Fulvivirga sp. M361]TRX62614.1 hypothetical protein FNH22_00535 [Fulvivirga sp. M361]